MKWNSKPLRNGYRAFEVEARRKSLLASRAMAARVLASPATDDAARLQYAFRLATSREASENELETLADYLAKHQALFADDRERAETVVGEEAKLEEHDVHELATWTMLSRVLLNLDETVSRP
ncbi:hypothetical protein [Aeoliella sp. SH292]|uniref:hypothetical protein n=1 Tax=Aeoliella sp. SH292 TaxID=3454464 RepID=UPI003F94832B